MASPVEPLRGCELDRVNDLHAVHERLVDRATLGHLRKTIPLSVSEHPMNRHLGSDPVDPTVGPLVAVQAVVRVDSVEFEPHVDPGEAHALVVRVHP